jgi:F-type H+-transporting ATPase subunit b
MHFLSLSHEGFGINTNILETNVLNLGVVIAFVFVNLGKVYTELLETRRDKIVKAIDRAEEKYKEAQAVLQQAKLDLAAAKYKTISIRSEGRVFLKRLQILLLQEAREEQIRLQKTEYEKRVLVEKKSLSFIQSRLLALIFAKAPKKIVKSFENTELMNSANLYWIETLTQRVKE